MGILKKGWIKKNISFFNGRHKNNAINAEELIELHQKAANEGDSEAQFTCGFLHEMFEEYDLAVKYYSKAAELGVVDANYHLGRCIKMAKRLIVIKEKLKLTLKASSKMDIEKCF